MSWTLLLDWLGAIMILVGVGFTLIAAIGLVRLPDAYARMHAATKPQLLGLSILLIGAAVSLREVRWTVLILAVLVLQVVAAPTGSHLMGRAIHRAIPEAEDELAIDEWKDELSDEDASDSV